MPAMSCSDQPSVGRIRLTTTRTGRRRRSGRAARPARGPAGTARPGRRCRPRRSRRRPRARPGSSGCGRAGEPKSGAGSCSRLKPVSTTTCAVLARHLEQVLDDAGADLDPPVGARQAGHDASGAASSRPLHRGEPLLEHARPRPAGRPTSRPETSSRMPSCWATAPPYGSASTSTVRSRRRASSAARPVATVVRPGAPAGPHTATTRPAAVGGRSASGGRARPARTAGVGRLRRRRPTASGKRVEVVVGDDRPDPDPGRRAAGRRRGSRRRARSRPAGRRARAGGRPRPGRGRARRAPSTATSAWPAVAAASRSSTSTQRLSTTTPACSPSRRERVRTPRPRPRPRQHEDDDHAQPRRTTVSAGSSSGAEQLRRTRSASSAGRASTSWRRAG